MVNLGVYKTRGISYVDFAKVPRDVDDVCRQKIVERYHMNLFTKEDIVSKILNDLRNVHKTTSNHRIRRGFNIDQRGIHDSGRDVSEVDDVSEDNTCKIQPRCVPEKDERAKSGELRFGPNIIAVTHESKIRA